MKLSDLWCRTPNFRVLPIGTVVVDSHPEAERIAAAIREYPEDWAWQHMGYELKHVPTGFVLWVANEDYGLKEVTPGGGSAKFSEAERKIIWPAVADWLRGQKIGFTGRLPKVSITGRSGVYLCVAEGHVWAGAGRSPAEAYTSWARAVSVQARKDTNPGHYLRVWSGAL